ncbi:TonB-dependent receptor [Xenophilus sp. AP218F]|nr:TonB-dependent receptor [Xenophilus sp. AP218F]
MFKPQTCAALVALACAGLAQADNLPQFAGDPVIVTASKVPQKLADIPASVTVVTSEQIANSAARSVQGVLSEYAGVHVFNNSGSAGASAVDLRGFGMTASSNTLILVDGVRQNTNDLASPNLGAVSLASIERIEIVRGAGSVAYGGGTTGGVINIITKSGSSVGVSGDVTLTGGSYDLRQLDANLHAANQFVALDGNIQSLKTDNYRQNNAERNDSANIALTLKRDSGNIKFFAKTSSQGLRLPGYLTSNPAKGLDPLANYPTATFSPDDSMSVASSSGGVSLSQDIGSGTLYADVSRRSKDTSARYHYPGFIYADSRTQSENTGSARYALPLGAHELTFGVDWLSASSAVDGGNSAAQKRTGYFLEGQFKPWQGATVSAGGRQQLVDDTVADSSSRTLSTIDTSLHAWSLGLKQAFGNGWAAYARMGQSFRLGNSDEVLYTAGSPLVPQLSHDKELGVEWAGELARLKAAFFRNDLANEIAFLKFVGPMGVNTNLPKTRHQGLELEGRAQVAPSLEVGGNLTWTQATFREGYGLAGNTIPMVPKLMANLSAAWKVNDSNKLALAAQYVSEQHYDNDQRNIFPSKLPAYTVLDVKYVYRFDKRLSANVSVNNLLDKRYASYANANAATGDIALYPANGRNYQAAVTYEF